MKTLLTFIWLLLTGMELAAAPIQYSPLTTNTATGTPTVGQSPVLSAPGVWGFGTATGGGGGTGFVQVIHSQFVNGTATITSTNITTNCAIIPTRWLTAPGIASANENVTNRVAGGYGVPGFATFVSTYPSDNAPCDFSIVGTGGTNGGGGGGGGGSNGVPFITSTVVVTNASYGSPPFYVRPYNVPVWAQGLPFFTVSAHGIADGWSTVTNMGAMFGPDYPGGTDAAIWFNAAFSAATAYYTNYVATNVLQNFNFLTVAQGGLVWPFPGLYKCYSQIVVTNGTISDPRGNLAADMNIGLEYEGDRTSVQIVDCRASPSSPLLTFTDTNDDNAMWVNWTQRGITLVASNTQSTVLNSLEALGRINFLDVENCGFVGGFPIRNGVALQASSVGQTNASGIIGLLTHGRFDNREIFVNNTFQNLAWGMVLHSDHPITLGNTFALCGCYSNGTSYYAPSNAYPATSQYTGGGCILNYSCGGGQFIGDQTLGVGCYMRVLWDGYETQSQYGCDIIENTSLQEATDDIQDGGTRPLLILNPQLDVGDQGLGGMLKIPTNTLLSNIFCEQLIYNGTTYEPARNTLLDPTSTNTQVPAYSVSGYQTTGNLVNSWGNGKGNGVPYGSHNFYVGPFAGNPTGIGSDNTGGGDFCLFNWALNQGDTGWGVNVLSQAYATTNSWGGGINAFEHLRTGIGNSATGANAGGNLLTATNVSLNGYNALGQATGAISTSAMGDNAGVNNQGEVDYDIFWENLGVNGVNYTSWIGQYQGQVFIAASTNVWIGTDAGQSNTTGFGNVIASPGGFASSKTGGTNSLFGYGILPHATNVNGNSGVGAAFGLVTGSATNNNYVGMFDAVSATNILNNTFGGFEVANNALNIIGCTLLGNFSAFNCLNLTNCITIAMNDGINWVTGCANNIAIGNQGVNGDQNIIRIGATQTNLVLPPTLGLNVAGSQGTSISFLGLDNNLHIQWAVPAGGSASTFFPSQIGYNGGNGSNVVQGGVTNNAVNFTNVQGSNVVFNMIGSGSGSSPTANMANGAVGTVGTNSQSGNFTFGAPINVNVASIGAFSSFALNVTNTSGSPIVATGLATWKTNAVASGGWSITNDAIFTFSVFYGLYTNVLYLPIN